MDTWATSSLTPEIAGRWEDDPDLFARVYPMDMRAQAHDIIRTWLFATAVRAHWEHNSAPWRNAAISGWILDPDRKKMSKSKGNVVTPVALLDQYSTDAVRYWSASARPGVDTAMTEDQMKVGRKLAMKLLNVSKFVLTFGTPDASARATDPVDLSMLARLDAVVAECTAAFNDFDYARSLERTEAFFWWFCDDYVELVKSRAYATHGDAGAASAQAALRVALSTIQRLFAPFIPFTTEEVWSWWQVGSIHLASWPTAATDHPSAGDPALLDSICEVLAQVRRAKTEAKLSQRAAVDQLVVRAPVALHAALEAGRPDLCDAGSITQFAIETATEIGFVITLSEPSPAV
jgi:valyl-tRNA synthetase